jgi:hypothetical protein
MIIDNINKVYQDKITKMNLLLNKKYKYLIKFEKIGKYKQMLLIRKNKTLLSGLYTFYGIYQPSTKLWVWASSIPNVDMKTIDNINRIKSFSHLFESNNKTLLFYYQLLTQSSLYIEDQTFLTLINKLLLYLSNDFYIFNPINKEGNIQFIGLSTIKQKFM